jgi:hypothetical protein
MIRMTATMMLLAAAQERKWTPVLTAAKTMTAEPTPCLLGAKPVLHRVKNTAARQPHNLLEQC